MPLTKIIMVYFLTTCVFFAIDMIWLGFIAKKFYRKYLGGFLSDNVNWLPAIIFYLLFIAGILLLQGLQVLRCQAEKGHFRSGDHG